MEDLVMPQKPDVSIIIPTYNQANLLKICLESVIAQTHVNWEAIVINNFSQDNTIDAATSFGDERIKLINFANHGIIGAARNKGVQQAQANIIAFLDSDDFWDPRKLQSIVNTFAKKPNIDLICHDEWLIKEGAPKKLLRYGPYITFHDLLFKNNCLSTSAVVLKHSAFTNANGFSEDANLAGVEDYDLWLRLSKMEKEFFYLHEPLGSYRIHDNSYTTNIERQNKHTLNLLDKYLKEWQPKTFYYKLLIAKRYATNFRATGHSFMHRKENKTAKQFLIKGLRRNPFDWKAWLLLVMNTLQLPR